MIITCKALCLALYYSDGLPVRGAPADCACIEITPKNTHQPLPITLRFPKDKSPEPEPYDDRPLK